MTTRLLLSALLLSLLAGAAIGAALCGGFGVAGLAIGMLGGAADAGGHRGLRIGETLRPAVDHDLAHRRRDHQRLRASSRRSARQREQRESAG